MPILNTRSIPPPWERAGQAPPIRGSLALALFAVPLAFATLVVIALAFI
jgi:hypothetical protein